MTSAGFAGDRGDADPLVLTALAAVAAVAHLGDVAGVGAAGTDIGAREARLMSVLSEARFLVPVVAAPAEGSRTEGRPPTEMATVTLTGPDGSTALPAFTSLAALTAWDPTARPVPVTAASAARGALEDGCSVLLVDLGSEHAVVLRSSMLWALAQEREWVPPFLDPLVLAALAEASSLTHDVLSAEATDGSDRAAGVTEIELTVPAGLGPDRVERLVLAIGERLSADPDIRCRLDELAIRLRPGRLP